MMSFFFLSSNDELKIVTKSVENPTVTPLMDSMKIQTVTVVEFRTVPNDVASSHWSVPVCHTHCHALPRTIARPKFLQSHAPRVKPRAVKEADITIPWF